MPPRFEGKFGIQPSHTIESELTKALYRLPESVTPEEISNITTEIVHRVDTSRSLDQSGDPLTESEINTLKLKLARHFEDGADVARLNIPTFVDALIETPKFLRSDKGSIKKLYEIHEVKTLQKIAELRRKRAEQTNEEGLNPYENLFETSSGDYYVARLLNLPHLEQESEYMDHCVGTSESYINKIKRGEVEIFSLRAKNTHEPVVTIEYDTKSGQLLQVKTLSDGSPTHEDDFFGDLLESIEMLKGTQDDENKMRSVDAEAVQYYKLVDAIVRKSVVGTTLDRNELFIIYEIDATSFGFEGVKDSRVEELRQQRDRQSDIVVLCDCPPEYIAADVHGITETTQVFYQDIDDKLSLVDFREEKNKQKLSQVIEFSKAFKETGSPARLDIAIEGGIVRLSLDQKTIESLQTYKSAIAAYKEADTTPDYIYDSLEQITWTKPQFDNLDVYILNHGNTAERERDQMVADMDKVGYRVLTFSELVALGIVRPDLNKRNEVFNSYERHTLGGASRVPYLNWDGAGRYLLAYYARDDWYGRSRFLFVRK